MTGTGLGDVERDSPGRMRSDRVVPLITIRVGGSIRQQGWHRGNAPSLAFWQGTGIYYLRRQESEFRRQEESGDRIK